MRRARPALRPIRGWMPTRSDLWLNELRGGEALAGKSVAAVACAPDFSEVFPQKRKAGLQQSRAICRSERHRWGTGMAGNSFLTAVHCWSDRRLKEAES